MDNKAYKNIYLLNIGLGLLILGFVIHYYNHFSKKNKSNFKSVETYIKSFDDDFEVESSNIINLLPDVSFKNYSKYEENDYVLLTFKNDSLIRWNKNTTIISKEYIQRLNKNEKLVSLNNGYYYIHTKNKQIGRDIYTIAGLLPVYYVYEIENKYLRKKFNDAFELGKVYDFVLKDLDDTPSHTTHINQSNGNYLFSITVNKSVLKKYSFLSIFSFIAGLIVILLYINNLALDYLREEKLQIGYSIIAFGIVLIGCLILLLDYVPGFNDLQLFNPTLYASSKFSGSLGDLFLSLVLITWLIAFLYRTLNVEPVKQLNQNMQTLIHFALSFAFGMGGIYISKIIASLVIDSTIDFDVFAFLDQANLNSLLLALLCMVLLITIFFCMFSLLQKLYEATTLKKYYKLLSLVAALIVAFLFDFGISFFFYQSFDYLCFVFAVLLIVVAAAFQYYGMNATPKLSSNRFFIWLTFGSLFLAIYVFALDNEKERDQRKLLAKQLAKGDDPNTEYELNTILQSIGKDPYLAEFVTSRYILKKTLDDRLITKYFADFISRFEITTYVFGNKGFPVKSGGKGPKRQELTTKRARYGRNTIYPNLTLFRDKANRYHYMGSVPIFKDTFQLGDLYVEIEPKSKEQILVYPELLQSKVQGKTDEISDEYSYAFYEKSIVDENSEEVKLTGQKGVFEYPNSFNESFTVANDPMLFEDIDGYSHLIYQIPDEEDFYLVLSKNKFNPLKLVSLFSFIYALVIVFFGLLWLTYTFFNALITHSSPFKYFFSSFSNRLNASLMALLFFSFVLTGAIITYFLFQQFDNYDNSRLLAKKEAVETRLKSEISEQRLKDSDFIVKISADFKEFMAENTILSNAQIENQREIELSNNAKKIKLTLDSLSYSLSKVHGVDINIFNIEGDLIGSSTSISKELLPEKLSPAVLKKLIINDNYETQQSEKIGELAYTSFYFQLKNNINDKLLSIINIPYYTNTDKTTQNNVAEFILALINVYVFLFILGSLFALLLSKTLTRSLTKVSEKMGAFRLGQKHDPIEWFYNDEIGKLISGYNQMIEELEISANLLAQSERQTAWREMARQVAHEIKNPLTPMKLSIQHLQRALKDNSPNVNELTGKVTKTLGEQIENLANIASQFSSFAKMPEAQNSIININELIGNVLPLYDDGAESVAINYNHPEEPYWIYSDKNRLVQVFNNLIQNAIQSIPEERKGIINVQSVRDNGEVHISFKDNGSGIPVAIQHKVFTPNFTTKGSGMGLGLAITKQIIEQSNGKIYFKTEIDEGTTFFIELPIKEKTEIENLSAIVE